ncbi:MAG: Fic/DOC family protein [bacterium ADurb.Bin400]|nr:MAG: Fic/DOC family protein [bacterium ADurb.Bin400]
MIFRITIQEVELIAYRMAKELLKWDEPIPDFSTRFPYSLESCLSEPFQTFNKRALHVGLYDQAASLFYLMIKNHPFRNGNKRIAITTLFHFLSKNGKWIRVENQELYNFAVWVASSPPQFREETLSAIKKFLKNNVVEI